MKNWKTLTLCLAAFLGLLLLTAPKANAEAVESGTCGENLTWVLDSEGTLTISGTGPMSNYYIYSTKISSSSPFSTSKYDIKSVVIGEGVTTIGESVFYHCFDLTSVTIPNSVTAIGANAFNGTALTSVTIPNSVTTIGNEVFKDCINLTNITIPESVTTIGEYAFAYCTNLTGIWVDENNPNYCSDGFGVLYNKNMNESLAAPGVIQNYIFPDSVITIGDGTFGGCGSLTGISMPDSVTTIAYCAFYNCTSLADVYYADNEEQWSQISIGSWNNSLTEATIHYNSTGPSYVKGWNYINNIWYFYENSTMLKNQWKLIGGKWYYFESNGIMAADCWKKDSTGWV